MGNSEHFQQTVINEEETVIKHNKTNPKCVNCKQLEKKTINR